MPRFTGENRARNQRLVTTLAQLATARGVRPSQLAIAWVLANGRSIWHALRRAADAAPR